MFAFFGFPLLGCHKALYYGLEKQLCEVYVMVVLNKEFLGAYKVNLLKNCQ